MKRSLQLILLVLVCGQLAAAQTDCDAQIASMIDPAKLSTLGVRGANQRVQKCVNWLAVARSAGRPPTQILDAAVKQVGYSHPMAAKLTKEALQRNLDIADRLGCLDVAGLAEMRRGRAPTIRLGPCKG